MEARMVSVDGINEVLDRLQNEAMYWVKQEGFAGNTDKESWWKGAEMQTRKIKAIVNNEVVGAKE